MLDSHEFASFWYVMLLSSSSMVVSTSRVDLNHAHAIKNEKRITMYLNGFWMTTSMFSVFES